MVIHIGGTMRARRMEGEARRDQIAQAVLALAAEQGTSAVSIAAVAHRIGVAPSALYRHYPSKDAMLSGTLERLSQRMLGNIERARASARGPVETLERLLLLQVELIRDNRGLPFVVFSEGTSRAAGHRERFLEFIVRFRAQLAALFREAQKAGEVRADIPAENLAVSFIGLYVPPAILWNLTRGHFDITAQARRAWTVFHDGIRARSVPATRARRRTRAPRAQEKNV
jgi:TetR/AcrR family fatty acid metabolism transcriptional regulator